MQSSSTFTWISGPIPEVKRYALINDYENIIVYSGDSFIYNCLCRRTSAVSSKYIWQVWRSVSPQENLAIFTPIFTLILETAFPALKLTQSSYISKYKHTLFLKTGNLILNWVPLSFFYKHPMPERVSSPSYPSQFFSELGIIWKYYLGLCLKKEAIFHLFFLNWEKLRSPARAT